MSIENKVKWYASTSAFKCWTLVDVIDSSKPLVSDSVDVIAASNPSFDSKLEALQWLLERTDKQFESDGSRCEVLTALKSRITDDIDTLAKSIGVMRDSEVLA